MWEIIFVVFRDTKVPMDELKLATSWRSSGVDNASVSVKINGLLLEGCMFDGSRLVETHSNSPSVTSVSSCSIAWVPEVSSFPFYRTFFHSATSENLDAIDELSGTRPSWGLRRVVDFYWKHRAESVNGYMLRATWPLINLPKSFPEFRQKRIWDRQRSTLGPNFNRDSAI